MGEIDQAAHNFVVDDKCGSYSVTNEEDDDIFVLKFH